MKFLGPKEAANEIRDTALQDRSLREDPAQVHAMQFAKQVATELGLDHTVENVTHVISLLREHSIGLHQGHEYPKHVRRGYDGAVMTANSEQEEHDIVNAEAPPPVESTGRFIQDPPHGGLTDISRNVPHMVPSDQTRDALLRNQNAPGDRQPSDLRHHVPDAPHPAGKIELNRQTDHFAAQGQHRDVPGTQHDDTFAQQEPGAAAMRQSFVDTGVDSDENGNANDLFNAEGNDEVVVHDPKDPTHDQPAAKPKVNLSKRPE